MKQELYGRLSTLEQIFIKWKEMYNRIQLRLPMNKA